MTILSVAASAACVPMNPAYGAEELDRYFADLRPRALITAECRIDSPARHVALSRRPCHRAIDLHPTEKLLHAHRPGRDAVRRAGEPSDVALFCSVRHSRPKDCPADARQDCTCSVTRYGAALALRRIRIRSCLNVLPLFHGHGLVATVVASLAAGASVVCTPGFDVNSFFAWLTAFQPTWYSAVPTMHQAILAQTRLNRERAANCRLRFVRSSSAPLPPRIFAELEQTLETPVIEWYGMGEVAASPIACNPLPPRQRKPGSVGVPVGLDVAIMDEAEALLPDGQTGQVVVRGPSVMVGYDGNPMATDAAFAGEWLKTGDLGFFDDDGYLFLTGRLREIINRGGEKIAPQEVRRSAFGPSSSGRGRNLCGPPRHAR